jgi:hypothetical protein
MTDVPCVNPPHDPDDPQGHLNAIEAIWLASEEGVLTCPHCHLTKRMLPMSGNGWGVELEHQPGCPEHDDSLPTPQRPGAQP